ncbi:MAG: hypothetical protein GF417_03335 [Candidatus Latescibacteria bacterium]|nr:hypothetical protein [bacterium]MBD3423461.1 hypothetical protein [Candidatus Latescibacterota bacterium]
MKRFISALLLIFIFAAGIATDGLCRENTYYSVLFPGWGQMKDGRYGKGTLFMGAELVLLTGVLMSNIQYDRDVDQYEEASAAFRSATYIGDKLNYNRQMMDRWDDADRMDTYRKVLAGAAVGVWLLNIADMVWSEDQKVKPVTLDVREDGFLVTKSFSF